MSSRHFVVDDVNESTPRRPSTRRLVIALFLTTVVLLAAVSFGGGGESNRSRSIGEGSNYRVRAGDTILSVADLGLATMGYRVMQTIGNKITELTPSRGYCATLAAAVTVVLASNFGLPVSTTHIAVGAVLGVGLARGIGAVDLRVLVNIAISWIVTLPVGGFLAAIFFFTLKAIFG